ncbi:hypothetical protein ACIBG7_16765 [Nonomuraea sp. NPDC050328]|uniref:hypothetical protein n=1 Tax=Nonomuraea sp. NPDC050328 TaxID=3364361 RepID=UPI003796C54E
MAGAFIPAALTMVRRGTSRLFPVIRLAAADLARNARHVAGRIAVVLMSTAFAVTVIVVAAAESERDRVEYRP